jgi:dTDP-4-dehydrorhamnose 3,5-epimerase
MEIRPLALQGVFLITPDKYPDNRGYFFETFNLDKLLNAGIFPNDTFFCQDNESFSKAGVIRGLHYQKEPFAQGKLVRVVSGRVIDVAVDLRKESQTYGNYLMQELDDKQKNIMWVPQGFAHGFVALEDSIFNYKVSGKYMPSHEAGIRWDDPTLNIPWPIQNPIVSDKDGKLSFLN